MAINFLPNDPLATGDAPLRAKSPRADRPGNRAGFRFFGGVPEAKYDVGTSEFLYWQCREAALGAIAGWEQIAGPLNRWAQNRRLLSLRQNQGVDLNAYYNRSGLLFFEHTTGNKTTYSGASTDVVAHEAGHACLDAIRPDLWSSLFTEVNAFHEAFGDCLALLTALEDKPSRVALIAASPSMWSENFLEATAEDLSDGIRREYPGHSASKPRHAFNWFNWQLPTTLPVDAPPGQLSSEIHTFGQIFSGCLWDLIGLLWNRQPSWADSALRTAARTAGKLLVEGTRNAIETPRFFQSVGNAMLAADQDLNNGAHQEQIIRAFAFHNIAISAAPAVSPLAALSGPSPRIDRRAGRASVAKSTRDDLLSRIGAAAGTRLQIRAVTAAGKSIAEAISSRRVSLTGLSERLRGVVAEAAEPVRIGAVEGRAAILGALPQADVTVDEVRNFVAQLVHNNAIAYKGASSGGGAVAGGTSHEVVVKKGVKTLQRACYACRVHAHPCK